MPATTPLSRSELPPRLSQWIWLLLVALALCIGRAATSQNENLLDLRRYAHLAEKSPFQERLLMAYPIRAAEASPRFLHVYDAMFRKTVSSPEDLAVSLVNCVCLLALLPVIVALRGSVRPSAESSWLAPLLTLLVVAMTYVVHFEQRFTMPYDQLSLFFYSVGLLAVLRGHGWLLLLVLAVATPNRETALFLLPAWGWVSWRDNRRLAALLFAAAGLVVWIAWRVAIAHLLHEPHQSWDLPWRNNLLSVLVPLHWPQLLEVFGFLAIPLWLLRGLVRDARLRALWVGTAPFLLAAAVVGIWRETRIFGELSALVGVTFAVELEAALRRHPEIAGEAEGNGPSGGTAQPGNEGLAAGAATVR